MRAASVKNKFTRTPSVHGSQIRPPPRRPSPYACARTPKQEKPRESVSGIIFNDNVILSNKNLKTFEGIEIEPTTKNLYVQNNSIKNFKGLGNLQHLETIDLSENEIENFAGFPHLPQLKSINLLKNPITQNRYYKVALIILAGDTLRLINGERINASDRKLASAYLKDTHILIRNGWNVTFPPPTIDQFPQIKSEVIGLENIGRDSPAKPQIRVRSMNESVTRRLNQQEAEKKRLQQRLAAKK